ncbi:MAG: Oligopeptide transport ATP-binding protein OppF [Alphaproteobacteria bacterium ADurb.Bin438]|nr:MAG: Oligopeptide transport ATP-binding protein OppF [Alphaproteobacteria bacterium ADurb.Bin438]
MLNDIDISHLKINELRPYRKDIGVVFQDPFASLNPRMSIFEIVKEGLDVA